MIKIQYLLYICALTIAVVFGVGDTGKGRWSTVSVGPCDEEGELDCTIDIVRRKYNRSLDVFDVTLACDKDIDDSISIVITICKHVDGGCKEWQVISDDSVPRFGKKYAENNVKRAFEMAQFDPPDFPIKAGNYSLMNFAMDYCELPDECWYGRYTAVVKLNQGAENIACLLVTVEFDEDTEAYECD